MEMTPGERKLIKLAQRYLPKGYVIAKKDVPDHKSDAEDGLGCSKCGRAEYENHFTLTEVKEE